MLIAHPFQFKGRCAGCYKQQGGKGPAVAVGVSDEPILPGDDFEPYAEWLCARCALRLAKKILAAVARAKMLVAKGFIYRGDKWAKRAA